MVDADRQTTIEPPAPPAREPAFNLPPTVLLFIAVCVVVHLLRVYVLTADQDLQLLLRTAFVPIRYTGGFDLDVYAFTSPVTYSLLHGGMLHLAVNMVWLAAFGSPLANRLGWMRFCLFWVVTSVAAAALHFALHHLGQAPLVGASGAISGMMGAAARFGFRMDRTEGRSRFLGDPLPVRTVLGMRNVVVFLGVWMIVNLVTGLGSFTPGVDSPIAWEAHVGGFLAGFFWIGAFAPSVRRRRG
jgi:membrane associated rhomboid family serine protease